jgi:hypothetical protein
MKNAQTIAELIRDTFWPTSQRIGQCSQEACEVTLPAVPRTLHRHIEIDGVQIFNRESLPASIVRRSSLVFATGTP